MSCSAIPCAVRPIDGTVYKLVTSWLGTFPETLNVTLKDFLMIGPVTAAQNYGREFARKHHSLIREILSAYADSVSLLGVPEEVDYDADTRCNAFVEGEYDEDRRCDAFIDDEYDDDRGRYSHRRHLSAMATQRM